MLCTLASPSGLGCWCVMVSSMGSSLVNSLSTSGIFSYRIQRLVEDENLVKEVVFFKSINDYSVFFKRETILRHK